MVTLVPAVRLSIVPALPTKLPAFCCVFPLEPTVTLLSAESTAPIWPLLAAMLMLPLLAEMSPSCAPPL